MNAIASPAAKDPDELIDRFVHYVGLFEESASRADALEHKVTVMKEDLDDARNATQKEKYIAEELKRTNGQLTDSLTTALISVPDLEATKKRNHQLLTEINDLKARIYVLNEEKVRLESESAASLAALRGDMEKRDAAHEARIDRLRQFALKEKTEICSDFEKKLDRKLAAAEKQHKFQTDAQTRDLVRKIESLTKNEEWMRCKLEQQQQQVIAAEREKKTLRSKISSLEEKLDESDFEARGKKRGAGGGGGDGGRGVSFEKGAATMSVAPAKKKRDGSESGIDMRRVAPENQLNSHPTSTSSSKKGILKRDQDGGGGSDGPSSSKQRLQSSGESVKFQSTVYALDDDDLPDCYSLTSTPETREESQDNVKNSDPVQPLDLSPRSTGARHLSKNHGVATSANRAWGQSGSIPPLDTTTRRPKAVKTALTFS